MVCGTSCGRARVRRHRLRPDRRRQQDQRGDDLHPAQALGRAQGYRRGRDQVRLREGRDAHAKAPSSRSIRRRSAASARPAASRSIVQDRADGDPQKLCRRRCSSSSPSCASARSSPGVNTFFRPTVPQLLVEVDREKALSLGVPVTDVFDALQSTMGALYVNDFNKFGRTYRVQMQADGAYRARARGSGQRLRALVDGGDMIPLKSADARCKHDRGPEQIDRFNGFLSAKVLGSGAAGDQLRAGHRRRRGGRRDVAARRLHDRVDRPGVPGKAHRHGVDHRLRVRDRSWCS